MSTIAARAPSLPCCGVFAPDQGLRANFLRTSARTFSLTSAPVDRYPFRKSRPAEPELWVLAVGFGEDEVLLCGLGRESGVGISASGETPSATAQGVLALRGAGAAGRMSEARLEQAKETGTGLGLAIAKGIVEQHGGLIGVDANPGGGSRFWIELPADVVRKGGSSGIAAGG